MFKNEKGQFILNRITKRSLAKEKYLLLVDVETCNDNKIILDFSYNIISTKGGAVIEKGCLVIKESWETRSFKNGIYAKGKKKDYSTMLRKGQATLISKQDLYNKLNQLIDTYNLSVFMAYNGSFDLEAIYNTFDYQNKKMKLWKHKCWRGKENKPKFMKLDLLDLWTYASVLYKTPQFKKWYDKEIALYSSTGNRKTNAEIMARYIKENNLFLETHKGIEDLEIEYGIFIACIWHTKNKVVLLNYIGLWGAWKLAQNEKLSKDSKLYNHLVLQQL